MGECNDVRINAMKNRWIGPMLFAAALALGACAPTQEGADETASPTSAATASPTMEAEAAETPEPAGTPKPAETPYDY
jgi:hypothetical protein